MTVQTKSHARHSHKDTVTAKGTNIRDTSECILCLHNVFHNTTDGTTASDVLTVPH